MKKSMAVLIGAGALFAGGAAQAATPLVTVQKTGIEINQKQTNQEQKGKQTREIAPDMFGGLRFDYFDRGRSPKEYGMWLQATGRQKWNKRKR